MITDGYKYMSCFPATNRRYRINPPIQILHMAQEPHVRLTFSLACVVQVHIVVQIEIRRNTRNVSIQTNCHDVIYVLQYRETTTGKTIRNEITAIYTSLQMHQLAYSQLRNPSSC